MELQGYKKRYRSPIEKISFFLRNDSVPMRHPNNIGVV